MSRFLSMGRGGEPPRNAPPEIVESHASVGRPSPALRAPSPRGGARGERGAGSGFNAAPFSPLPRGEGGRRPDEGRLSSTTGLTRRTFLAGAAATAFAARAHAIGPASEVDLAEIQLKSGTVSRPEAWTRLLFELLQSTSVEAEPRVVQLAPDDPALFRHPFAVLAGGDALPTLSEAAIQQLVRYLSYGGFLYIDDVSGERDSAFDASIRQMVRRLFPTRPLTVLPSDHSVYRAFFLLREPVGRVALHRTLEGVSQGSMHPLIYGRDDLSGALDRRPDGSDAYPCTPGGELQRREAVKLAVNLMMYGLTSNYKQDQAHVEQLIREGRLE